MSQSLHNKIKRSSPGGIRSNTKKERKDIKENMCRGYKIKCYRDMDILQSSRMASFKSCTLNLFKT